MIRQCHSEITCSGSGRFARDSDKLLNALFHAGTSQSGMLTSATPKATMNSANKRRRLNDNAEILSKPFRSPLKVNKKQVKSFAHDADNDHHTHKASNPSHPQEKQRPIDDVKSSATAQESVASPAKDKDVTQLQREYAALCQQLRRRRQDADILQQALTIRISNQQDNVDKSIIRWRLIAREVADEMYVITSAQVKDMGGLQAMKKHLQDFAAEWSDAKESSSPDSCRLQDTGDVISNSEKANNRDQSDVEETEFNMTTMLHQLNIDPDLLGFDLELDDWRD